MDDATRAAYHGPAWTPRSSCLRDDIRAGRVWRACGYDTEYARLTEAMLYLPGPDIANLRDLDAGLHLRRIDHRTFQAQHDTLVRAYESLGVTVHHVDPAPVDDLRHPNLIFQRDLSWQTPFGAVISRMASNVRAGEERFTAATLANLHIPIALTVGADATFEGADALWLTPRTVLCGRGMRTNDRGYETIREFLLANDVECLAFPLHRSMQHLQGCVQIVSSTRAFVRTELVEESAVRLLTDRGFDVVPVKESQEITEQLAFNFVVVDRDTVVLHDGVPEFRRFLEASGVEVAACVPASEYVNAAGGLGCATGIVCREPR